jgi:hypothetical protein
MWDSPGRDSSRGDYSHPPRKRKGRVDEQKMKDEAKTDLGEPSTVRCRVENQ